MLAASRAGKWTWLESATVYAALGDQDDAFRALARMFEERDGLNYVKTDPRLDSLHADPRWQVLLRRMNFPAGRRRRRVHVRSRRADDGREVAAATPPA